jgi:hypothetical protein
MALVAAAALAGCTGGGGRPDANDATDAGATDAHARADGRAPGGDAATPSDDATVPSDDATTSDGGSHDAAPTADAAPTTDAAHMPPGSAKPDATNTGVPPGTALVVVDGDQTITTSDQVISGKDFHGFVTVHAHNVTFRNCIFRGAATNMNAALLDTEDATGTVVEDSEFVASHPSATIDCLWTASTEIYRAHIHGCVDGMKAGDNTLVQDSYIHGMSYFAHDPNQGGGETHNDGVQLFAGVAHVTLRHNNIEMNTTTDNSAVQSSGTDTHIENSWLTGGGCSLNFAAQATGGPLTGIYVVDNRFGPSFYTCPILISTMTTLSQNTGNVWDSTGEPIPPPQQHD